MAASASTLSVFNHSPRLINPYSEKRSSLTCCSSNNKKKSLSFVDQILDYIEGGPKLRKWYGASDLVEKDRNLFDEDKASEEDEIRDAVLVTDGDNEIGQMVILSLVVKRIRVKAVVKDKRAAIEAFGTYVEVDVYIMLKFSKIETFGPLKLEKINFSFIFKFEQMQSIS